MATRPKQGRTADGDLARQADELDRLLTALIQRYQFRDRNSICCGDITVSQCYVMKELGRVGPLTMGALAGAMCLAVSTLTRVVDQLEKKGCAVRVQSPSDRRVWQVELTPAGRALLAGMEKRIRRSEKEVLGRLGPADRSGLLKGLRKLMEALEGRGGAACPPGGKGCTSTEEEV
ncbi:MAG TPA: MarR family transcriptional regulator [Candidatus Polarisedimenticolia bacterium]|nr:MarR family transcriptional regulator [Candidatus Polarisedimenticolia bacterium]